MFNVKTYGATGDGSTDDTASITSAFSAANGAPVYFPAGSYIDTASRSLAAGQMVFGDGPGLTTILTRHASLPWLVVDAVHCVVRDLKIIGNAPNNGTTGIRLSDTASPARYALVQNVWITNCTSHGIRVKGAWKCTYINVRCSSNGGDGFNADDNISSAAHHCLINCNSEGNGGNGFTVTSASVALGFTFANCVSITNSGDGYSITNSKDVTLVGSYSASEKGSTGEGLKANGCAGISVHGGGFHDLTTGIELTNCTSVVIEGVAFVQNNTQHIYVKTGSSGESRCCYFNAGTAVRTDAGAVYWLDAEQSNTYAGGATHYNDGADIIGWRSFTPTWTSSGTAPSLGNGTLVGRYRQEGKNVKFEMSFTTGSTTRFGTGSYSWALPVPARVAFRSGFSGHILDSGTALHVVSGFVATRTTLQVITEGSVNVVAQTIPMTWASGDRLILSGEYEAALN